MAAKYWIKAWLEILDDAKMGLLSDRQWRRAVELMLYAGELGDSGELPDSQRIAWRLRCDAGVLAEDLAALSAVSIVIPREGGGWLVRKFAERQAPVSAAERSRQYRARKGTGAQQYRREMAQRGVRDVSLQGPGVRHVSLQDPVTKRDERGVGDAGSVTFRDIESDTDTDSSERKEANRQKLNHQWADVRAALRLQMTPATFNELLTGATLVEVRADACVIGVRSQRAADWLEHRLGDILARTFERVLGRGDAFSPRAVEFKVIGP